MTTLTPDKPPDKPPPLFKHARVLLVGGGFVALLLFGPPVAEVYVNWLWYGEVGFRSVWVAVLATRAALFVAVALVASGAVFVAAMLAYRSRPMFVPESQTNDSIAPFRTQVMRRPGCSGGASRSPSAGCAL